jgi:hypothetical protein
MANGKRQISNGPENHLPFALCHLPFAIPSTWHLTFNIGTYT